ncbi:MAG TPA: 5-(carboxyamino)imidazole ribonucleotide synthase [Bryobacteraceae bacterium]|nr:5-(carboxyamino)imidazole ribonucleotide synthase [Bryobacteraceae bacterium]
MRTRAPSTRPVMPGAAIGVLGSGQLGRMLTIAARRMGYRVHTYSPDEDTPTGQVSDVEIMAPYEDLDRVREFARAVSVVTFEFENVPASTAAAAAEFAPVRPAGEVLHTTQHRLREKSFLSSHGFPVTPYAQIDTVNAIKSALKNQGCPALLKTADFGYDGKGQFWIRSVEDIPAAWEAVGGKQSVLECFVDFDKEVSVIAARGADGSFVHYGVIENEHRDQILDISICPARLPEKTAAQAVEIAREVLDKLGVVGVLCVEFFVSRRGDLLINELAPRPHNSGHLTFDACVTSQFEQQVRAVCGLPLGSPVQMQPAAMANLLGDLWSGGEPDWPAALAIPEVKLHLYGKLAPRPGRKMGHLTALGENAEESVRRARTLLSPGKA